MNSRVTLCFVFSAVLFAGTCMADRGLPSGGGAPIEFERAPATNAAGQRLRNADGTSINYAQAEWQEVIKSSAASSRVLFGRTDSASTRGTLAQWGYAGFGTGIGLSGIVLGSNGIQKEIYLGGSTGVFGANKYWYALTYDNATQDYRQVYVSHYYEVSSIVRILLAQRTGAAKMIVVALNDGTVELYAQSSKRLLKTLKSPCANVGGLSAMEVADLDGDGSSELISLCHGGGLYVNASYGYGKRHYRAWSLAGVSGSDIAIGQMDNDPALEIALTDGSIVDAGTHAVQWKWSEGFGAHLKAADIDSDGRQELIAANAWYYIWAYDIERQASKWSIHTSHDIGAIEVTDIDGDGTMELLMGDGQWGRIHAFDTSNQVEEWAISNPEHGVTDIAVGDTDGDGTVDLLWGAGATSTGPDRLYVAAWQARKIKWENTLLGGPFLGPEVGDLDGDGVEEIVTASFYSESNYGGRIVVLDSLTRKVRAISVGVAGGVYDLKLRDLDGDGRPEILVAGNRLYDGLIEAYRFDANNRFTLVWTNAKRPFGAPFYSVDASDVDGDGKIEIVAGGGRALTGAAGVFIYVYDYASAAEKWHTSQMGGYSSHVADLAIADTDSDGVFEIIGMVGSGDVYVFDGATHALEATIPAKATSLTLLRDSSPSGIPHIVIGDASGWVNEYAFNGASYPKIENFQLTTGALDGIDFNSTGAILAGSDGVLRGFVAGVESFSTANYGARFGASIADIQGQQLMLSAGAYGIHGFVLGPRWTGGIERLLKK